MELLREWMRKNRWGVNALAEQIGTSASYLSAVLTGQRLSVPMAKKLSAFTGGEVPEEYMLALRPTGAPGKVRCPCCNNLTTRLKVSSGLDSYREAVQKIEAEKTQMA